MLTVFKKTDFILCKVPVPEGYKQSQTHSGIATYGDNYYLTTSPYPSNPSSRIKAYIKAILNKVIFWKKNKSFVPEQYENPCLYKGNVDSTPPYQFSLLCSSPLMPPPDPYYGLPAFNSDPDIFIEDNVIHVLNRTVYRTKICPGQILNKYCNWLYHIYGLIDNNRYKYLGTELLLETEKTFASPCLTKYQGKYVLTELETNSYIDGETFDGLYIAKSHTIEGFKDRQLKWEKIQIECGDYLPWHMSLFQYDGILYTVIACTKRGASQRLWQMLGVFNEDLSLLKVFETPLTDYKSYRGAACVDDSGEFVLYNTTVKERIKGGNSVDGREVIMAHAPFMEVLDILKKNGEQ